MVKSISFSTHEKQCKKIEAEILFLLKQVAYDGWCFIKIRIRKKPENDNVYIIELESDRFNSSKEIILEVNPFNFFWSTYYKKRILKKTNLKYCTKSKKGGYTFF